MTATTDKLARQIGILQAAYRVQFNTGTNAPENTEVQNRVAMYLESQGMTDLRNLRYYSNQTANLAFYFDVGTGVVFKRAQDTGIGTGVDFNNDPSMLLFVPGRWEDYGVYCHFTPDGYPILWSMNSKHLKPWLETFTAIASLAAIAVSVAFPALAATIGSTVMGPELAAAYPLVAQGIGNIAINTALSGGDVETAVVGAVSGGLGSGVGGFVAGATDSAIIGSVTAAATKTAIVGGNIGEAVAGSLLSAGLRNAGDLFSSINSPTLPQGGDMGLFDDTMISFDDPIIDPVSGAGSAYDWQWEGPAVDPLQTGVYDSTPLSSPGSIDDPYGAIIGVNPTAPPSSPSGVVTSAGGADLTQLALTALKLVTSWNSAGQPAPRTSNSTTQANANGTLTVRNPNGTVSTVQMPRGTPYLTTTGQLVTNNGDGTYTSVDSRGVVSTQAYAATGLGSLFSSLGTGQVSPLVLAGGAVALLLLLRR